MTWKCLCGKEYWTGEYYEWLHLIEMPRCSNTILAKGLARSARVYNKLLQAGALPKEYTDSKWKFFEDVGPLQRGETIIVEEGPYKTVLRKVPVPKPAGPDSTKKKRVLTEDERAKAVRLLRKEWTIAEVAGAIGCYVNVITRLARRRGLA